MWAPSGRELYYLGLPDAARPSDVRLFAVGFAATAPVGIGQPRLLFETPRLVVTTTPLRGYDIAPDGRRFLFLQRPDTPPAPFPCEMHVVLNWFEELKAKVPAGR